MANNSVVVKIDGDDSGFKKALSGIGKTASAAVKGITVGLGAAVTALGALSAASVKAYSEYEQLVGGVDTLFKTSSQTVQKYANQAYKTAGLSANAYMETVTSFSASLLQSLGGDTAKAAEYGNQAVIDMSDNANKMGTSIELIQNAYQGFAKQNFTMLDNLKLGYGGTKTEMERLLADAKKVKAANGEMVNYSIDSFADMVEAIHVIQENMDIAGTTAKEASTTIQGAWGMLKASWENLMTGLADPAQDLNALIQNVIDSATTLASNLMLVIDTVLASLPAMISELGTKILQELPNLVNMVLPELANTASQLVNALVTSISKNSSLIAESSVAIITALADTLIKNVPTILQCGKNLFVEFVKGISEEFPTLTTALTVVAAAFGSIKIGTTIQGIVTGFQNAQVAISLFSLETNGASLAQAALNGTLSIGETIVALLTGKMTLAQLAQAAMTKAQAALNAVMSANPIALVVIAITALVAAFVILWNKSESFRNFWIDLWENIKAAFQAFIDWVSPVIEVLKGYFQDLWTKIQEIWTYIVESLQPLKDAISGAFQAAWELIKTIWDLVQPYFAAIWENIQVVFSVVKDVLSGFFEAAWIAIQAVWDVVSSYFAAIWDTIKAVFSVVATYLGGMFETAWTSIKAVWDTVTGYFTAIWETIKGIFGVVKNVLSGNWSEAWEAIKGIVNTWADFFSGVWDSIKTVFASVGSWFGNTFSAAWTSIKGIVDTWKGYFVGVWSNIKKVFAIGDIVQIGKDLLAGLWNGINDKVEWLKGKVSGVVDKIKSWFTGKDGFDEHSPSKWSEKVFAYVIDGGVKGVVKNQEKLISATGDVVKTARTEVQKVIDEMNEELLDSEKKYNAESERLKESKSEADKKYLESLKNFADQERKIFDAATKDIENMKDSIIDSIEEVDKAQESIADKLKDYGDLYYTYELPEITIDGVTQTPEITKLSNLGVQTETLAKYYENLQKVKERGEIPQEFFEQLRDMSVDEGLQFSNALLSASDDEFNEYIQQWIEKQNTSEKIASLLLADEREELETQFKENFGDLPEDFFGLGKDSAEQYGDGFMSQIRAVFDEMATVVQSGFLNLNPSLLLAGAGAGGTYNTTTNSTTYNLYGQDNNDLTAQVEAYETRKRLAGIGG